MCRVRKATRGRPFRFCGASPLITAVLVIITNNPRLSAFPAIWPSFVPRRNFCLFCVIRKTSPCLHIASAANKAVGGLLVCLPEVGE